MSVVVSAEVLDAPIRHRGWAPIAERAPALAATAWRYLDQIALSLQPTSVVAVDRALRNLSGYLADAGVENFAAVERTHIEGFKSWLSACVTDRGRAPARNTIRQRLGMVRSFFDRIIEWDWPDAPVRTPMFAIDVPVADDPLPRFLAGGSCCAPGPGPGRCHMR
jgi:integrase/recombinase XerD